MSVNIRFPNITAGTEAQQITQIRSFLHQLVEQLNWVLSNMESGTATQTEAQSTSLSTSEFEELRAMMVRLSREIDTKVEQFVTKNALDDAVAEAIDGYAKTEDLEGFVTEDELEGMVTDEELSQMIVDHISDERVVSTECGFWRLNRYKSGLCRLEGSFLVTPSTSEVRTVLYRSNTFEIPIPNSIATEAVTATAKGCCFVEYEGISVDEETQESFLCFRLVSDAEFPADRSIEVGFSVTGTYFEQETGGDTNGES